MLEFYRGKRVLITGHTGFKGSWLTRVLVLSGAKVYGYALEPEEDAKALYEINKEDDNFVSCYGDIRDMDRLSAFFEEAQPEIVFHLAAQPIVLKSYEDPRYTYETNVMGTVNICECIRNSSCVKSFVNVTTDKVYQNTERAAGYKEEDRLGGFDPYSNSKSCSELVTQSYVNSFFRDRKIAVSTARAGNVIGGGDLAPDRLVPDLVRAALSGGYMTLRRPDSVRPFQHVLEALSAYLLIAQKQYEDISFAGAYNVGPEDDDCKRAGEVADLFAGCWLNLTGKEMPIIRKKTEGPHEAGILRLDCGKVKEKLGWRSMWDINKALESVAQWSLACKNGEQAICTDRQIQEYFKEV